MDKRSPQGEARHPLPGRGQRNSRHQRVRIVQGGNAVGAHPQATNPKAARSTGHSLTAGARAWAARSCGFIHHNGEPHELRVYGNQAIGGSGATASSPFADVGIGGGIMDIAGTLSLTNCALNGNQATGGSGAIIASHFTGVGVGGGIAMEGGTLTDTSCTLSANVAQGGFGTADTGGLGEGGGIGATLARHSR